MRKHENSIWLTFRSNTLLSLPVSQLINTRWLLLIFFFSLLTFPLVSFGFASTIPEEDIDALTEATNEVYHAPFNEVIAAPLKGGFSGDRLYKLTFGEEALAVRLQRDSNSFENKKQELLCSQIAYGLGIGPEVKFISKKFDVLATTFSKGKHPDTKAFDNPLLIKSLAKSLKLLHDGPDFTLPWSIFHYIRNITPRAPDTEMKLALRKLDKIEKAILKAGFPIKPSHNDMHAGNMFIEEEKISFIDWGDAGMGDPFHDVARISLLTAFHPEQEELFLSSYSGKITNVTRSRFFLMKQVFLLRMAFWSFNKDTVIDKNLLNIFEIFEAQNYRLPHDKNTALKWQDVSKPFLQLFLRNTSNASFENALKNLRQDKK